MTRFSLPLSILFAVIAVPSTALAVGLVCSNGFLVVECNDGHQIQCGSGNNQHDCNPDHMATYANSCEGHGGINGLVYDGSLGQSAVDLEDLDSGDAGGRTATTRR